MTDYLVIGKDGCSYCVKAKQLLELCDAPYSYQDIKEMKSLQVAQLEKIAGSEFRTVPQIFRYGERGTLEYVGGYSELSKEII
jgi:glutaredoxin 1